MFLVVHTWQRPIIGDVAGHVDRLAVNREVPHAADKLPVVHREIFWQVWDPTKQKRAGQVQRSEETKKWVTISCTQLVWSSSLSYCFHKHIGDAEFTRVATRLPVLHQRFQSS